MPPAPHKRPAAAPSIRSSSSSVLAGAMQHQPCRDMHAPIYGAAVCGCDSHMVIQPKAAPRKGCCLLLAWPHSICGQPGRLHPHNHHLHSAHAHPTKQQLKTRSYIKSSTPSAHTCVPCLRPRAPDCGAARARKQVPHHSLVAHTPQGCAHTQMHTHTAPPKVAQDMQSGRQTQHTPTQG
jgi:hypothetical protein